MRVGWAPGVVAVIAIGVLHLLAVAEGEDLAQPTTADSMQRGRTERVDPPSDRGIYVDPQGSDSNSGDSPADPLATCAAAVAKVAAIAAGYPSEGRGGAGGKGVHKGLPIGGVEVVFAAGTYPLTPDTACGVVSVQGSEAAPLVFRAAEGAEGKVIFDGTTKLDTTGMAPVTNSTVRALLNPAAIDVVQGLRVPSTSGWTGDGQMLQWGARPLTPSVWPDVGLGYIQKIYDSGAIYCPGRTKGPVPKCQICTGGQRSSPAKPCGANFSLAVPPTGDWERELTAGPGFGGSQAVVDGYLGADWFHESHPIAKVSRDTARNTTTLQLGDSSHYGICEAIDGLGPNCSGGDSGGAPGRFVVRGFLSNVDTPGEYFYDRASRVLYLIPPESPRGSLGFWAGPGLITLTNASWVTVRDFVVTGTAATGGAIAVVGGENNTVGGCTVQSCASGIGVAGGHRHRVLGNDVYDVTGFHVATASDADEVLAESSRKLTPTNHLVSNNQFTQVWLSATTWSVHSGGLGDRFSHNILHDAPGQLILPGGPLTMWDHNEVFNVGYAEGDGGMMYLHASLVKGYGMHIRENFLHHSLDVPGLVGRHAIQFDDHFGAFSNCSGNVLFKAAGIGIASSGAGNNVTHNLIMNTGMAIAVSDLEDMTVNLPLYDNGTLKRGDKMDYVWNAENDLGVAGSYPALFRTALAQRFPSFAKQMSLNSTHNGWASAAASTFTNNVFLNNSQCNVCFEDAEARGGEPNVHTWHGSTAHGSAGPANAPIAPLSNASAWGLPASHYMDWSGSVEAEWSWFPEADQLEFVNASLGFDTRQMGLYCDGWRRNLPSAPLCRPYVKKAFDDVTALPAHGHYTPEAAAIRSGLRTGRALVLNFTVPCPATLPQTHCRGVWLTWGECEANGVQIMRYTIETPALGGGAPCPWLDGTAAARPCT
eukprot:m.152458 g.152458  ORF g.152458 m.152458 type:complete len:932 (+) comp14323_c0_seq3:85-2880(+)